MSIKDLIGKIRQLDIDHHNIDYVINYLLFKRNLQPYVRYYKIIIKNIWCNAQCPMCNDWKEKWNKRAIRENLLKVFKEIVAEKIPRKYIQILWWEPLLMFDDLLKIIRIWSKCGIIFDFPTNASLLTIEKIDFLLDAWLDNFTFSLDYPDIKHDDWRKLPNTFSKIITFTKYLISKEVKVQWNTVVWNFNYDLIGDFQLLYKEISPIIHNFISIEVDQALWNEVYLLTESQIKDITLVFNSLISSNSGITFNLNWFSENISLLKYEKCCLPLKIVSYIVNEDGIINTMCHYHWLVKDRNNFIREALDTWCNKCNSWYRFNFDDILPRNMI